jgi:uncharacterized delta-60 repeat protein
MSYGLAIDGRVVEGEVLQARVIGSLGSLQWQALSGGNWVNVGAANATSYTVPTGAAGTAYRLVGTAAGSPVYSEATLAATADSRKASAPVLTGQDKAMLSFEDSGGPATVFDWYTLTDADKGNWGGGSLTLMNSDVPAFGGEAHTQLSIRFADGFTFNSATREISYPGGNGRPMVIGTVDAQYNGNGTYLKVNFGANATTAIVDALVDHLQYQYSDDSPVDGQLLTLRVADSSGGSVQRVMGVAIQATPDAPVFTGPSSFTVDENQTGVGSVSAYDPDVETGLPQGISYSLAEGAGAQDNARFAIDAASGAISFRSAPDYEDPNHAAQYSLRVRATDGEGSTTDQVVTVSLRNLNDAPYANNATATAQENGPAVRIAPAYGDPEGGAVSVSFNAGSTLGTVTQDGSGFLYNPNGKFESLAAGQSAIDSFSYTVTDTAGLSTTRTVQVTVQGQNDAATNSGTSTGTIVDEPGMQNSVLTASGQLTVSDVDQGQAKFSTYVPQAPSLYGTFGIDAGGHWTYNANNSQLQTLGEGQSVVERFTVSSLDGTATQEVRVTLQGSNDVPSAFSINFAMVTEAGAGSAGTPVAQGAVHGLDPDTGDVLSYSGSATGAYGQFAIDGATGAWTYTLDNSLAATDALRYFDSRNEQFTVTVSDGHGGSLQQAVQIIVDGSNDAPRNIQGDTTGTAHESAPDGKMVWTNGAAQGQYAVASDAAGHTLVLGKQIPPNPSTDYSSGGSPVLIAVGDAHVLYCLNPDGSRDASFGSNGAVRVSFLYDKLAVDAAGGYILGEAGGYVSDSEQGGGTPNDFTVACFLANGSADTSFGANGKAVVDFGGMDRLKQVIALPNGQALLAGSVSAGGNTELGVARLNANGTLDTTFGTNGKLVVTLPGEHTGAYQAVSDGHGGLLAWSEIALQGGGHEVHIAHYTATGAFDTAFGNNGLLNFSIGSWYANRAGALTVDASGGIVLGWGAFDYESAVGYRPMLTRFNADGTLDSSFGNGGTADVQVGIAYGSTYGLTVDAAGHLVLAPTLAGGSDADFGLVRVNANGALDTSFGTGGATRTDVGYGDDAKTVLQLPGGDLLLAGHTSANYQSDLAAFVRYNADGSLEQGFGGPADETITGWLTATDPDDNASSLVWSGSTNGVYGRFNVDAGGTWAYTVDNSRAATQNLGAGQNVTETFTATVRDSWGATASQQVVVTLVGAYDTPVT